MIKIKVNKGRARAKIKISGRPANLAELIPANLAELIITMVTLGEAVEQAISKHPEFGRKVKADCIKAFTMAANGSSRAEITEAITGKKD